MKEPNISEGTWYEEDGQVWVDEPPDGRYLICDTVPGNAALTEWDIPNAKLIAASKEMAKLLYRIYMADKTGNNGVIMGEALLCPYFSNAAHQILLKAGYTDHEPTETSHDQAKDN